MKIVETSRRCVSVKKEDGMMSEGMNPLEIQVGGNHYKDFVIQPVEYTMRNKLSFLQGCIIKRISRYNKKGGKGLQDLEKIKHEVDLIIELEGITHPCPSQEGSNNPLAPFRLTERTTNS